MKTGWGFVELVPASGVKLPGVIVSVGRGNETLEQGMRLMRLALEFRMKLAGNEKGMVGQFDDLNQLAVRRETAEDKPAFLETFPVGIIELVAMPVAFLYHKSAV